LNADGTYIYTLNNGDPKVQELGEGQTATDPFSYTVTDGQGHTGTATLTITVTGTNDAPKAGDDANAVPQDAGSVSGNVLINDTDTDNGDQPVVSAVDDTDVQSPGAADVAGVYGKLHLDANGHYTYTLNTDSAALHALAAGQPADDVFNYTVSDGHGGTSSAAL